MKHLKEKFDIFEARETPSFEMAGIHHGSYRSNYGRLKGLKAYSQI